MIKTFTQLFLIYFLIRKMFTSLKSHVFDCLIISFKSKLKFLTRKKEKIKQNKKMPDFANLSDYLKTLFVLN